MFVPFDFVAAYLQPMMVCFAALLLLSQALFALASLRPLASREHRETKPPWP